MKTANNQVTVKKAPIDLSNDSMVNIELAHKAIIHLNSLAAMGKNAQILSEVANNFANKKESSNVKALRKDNVLKGLESKVFQCQTIVKARSMTQNDNYFDYAKIIKNVLSKKAPLNEKQKEQVKTIVAKAQVLRNGFLSKYAHDEMSWLELQGHYGIEEKAPESVTDQAPAVAEEISEETLTESASINMEQFKNLVDSIELFSDAELALELIQAKMQALAAAIELKQAS